MNSDPVEEENLVVFASPSADQLSRARLWQRVLLFFLLPSDLVLAIVIFALGGPSLAPTSSDVSRRGSSADLVTFLVALAAAALCALAMRLQDTRMLTLFVVLYYVDALLSLVRISEILQLVRFLCQVAVCHIAFLHKQAIQPVWWIAEH